MKRANLAALCAGLAVLTLALTTRFLSGVFDHPEHQMQGKALTSTGGRDASERATETLADLPIVELPARPSRGAMAIIYSGDGGWRAIDKAIAEIFQRDGVPTVGVDSLRYFWSEKPPAKAACDLSRIIATYTRRWRVDHVLLVGYSFGADILPATFNALPAADRARVAQISLLGFASTAAFEITLSGWLGLQVNDAKPTMPEVGKIDTALLQCVYGAEDQETACRELQGSGVEIIETSGGHHFDGNYASLARKILNGLERRLRYKTQR